MAEASTIALRDSKGGAAEDLERRHLFARVIRRDLPAAPRSIGAPSARPGNDLWPHSADRAANAIREDGSEDPLRRKGIQWSLPDSPRNVRSPDLGKASSSAPWSIEPEKTHRETVDDSKVRNLLSQ